MQIISGRILSALRAVIYGVEGIGKTSLASNFPNPLFIDLEGGSHAMDVRRVEPPKTWDELLAILREIIGDPSVCDTVVIDTADMAEALCIAQICRKTRKTSIEAFG